MSAQLWFAPDINLMVDEFVAEARDDIVGLWKIVKELENMGADPAALREQTLAVVRSLLARGPLTGDPPYSANGFQVWADQKPDGVISRIRREWLALGRVPNIPDIVWFSRP